MMAIYFLIESHNIMLKQYWKYRNFILPYDETCYALKNEIKFPFFFKKVITLKCTFTKLYVDTKNHPSIM